MTRPAFAPAARAFGLTLAFAPALAAAQPGAPAAAAEPPRAFAVLRGRDTLVVERLDRAADGTLVSRLTTRGGGLPVGARVTTTYSPAPDGRVRRAVTEAAAPGAAAPAPQVALTFGAAPGDSVEVQVGNAPPKRFAAPPNAIPFSDLSVAPWELAVRRAIALGGGTVRAATIPFFAAGHPALAVTVAPEGRDSVRFTLNTLVVLARIAPDGRVLGMRVPAQGVEFAPVDPRTVSAVGAGATLRGSLGSRLGHQVAARRV